MSTKNAKGTKEGWPHSTVGYGWQGQGAAREAD
jgi:hypothetical protein